MRVKVVASVVLGALVLAPTALARPVTVPLPPHPPTVIVAACPFDADAGGCFMTRDIDASLPPEGVIYIRPPNDDRFSLEHERGHAFDWQAMSGPISNWATMTPVRARFMRIMRLHGSWWPEAGTPPAELFADAYAACRLRRTPGRTEWTEAYGYNPTPRQHRRVCKLIRTAALNHTDEPNPDSLKDRVQLEHGVV